MKELILILPEKPGEMLNKMISACIGPYEYKTITNADNLINLKNKKIIFAVELNVIGSSNSLNSIFIELYKKGNDSLKDSEGSLLIHSSFNSLTKTFAQNIIWLANNIGCSFSGRCIVEATKNLDNFTPMVKVQNISLEEICLKSSQELGKNLISDSIKIKNNKILVLHASNSDTSNTIRLWNMVKSNLNGLVIKEVKIENGTIEDCIACGYKVCKAFGKQTRCYYGGIVPDKIYPALNEASTLILLCPNYNDMLTANLVAVINRLTALFRARKFYDKNIYSIIVSGYSGGDAVAKQIISSMNINKTFNLPPYFSLLATANDKDAIYEVDGIEEKAKEFAVNIISNN